MGSHPSESSKIGPHRSSGSVWISQSDLHLHVSHVVRLRTHNRFACVKMSQQIQKKVSACSADKRVVGKSDVQTVKGARI